MDEELVQLETDACKLVEEYVETAPYKLNPDSNHVGKIVKSLAKRLMQRLSVRVNTTWRK